MFFDFYMQLSQKSKENWNLNLWNIEQELWLINHKFWNSIKTANSFMFYLENKLGEGARTVLGSLRWNIWGNSYSFTKQRNWDIILTFDLFELRSVGEFKWTFFWRTPVYYHESSVICNSMQFISQLDKTLLNKLLKNCNISFIKVLKGIPFFTLPSYSAD